ncbi:MAG: ribonuclease HII [Thermodesulfobacteriota bacterium]
MWTLETMLRERGFSRIAGIDEAGRGPLAGPVVSAAVILPHGVALDGVKDSKTLTERQRERLYGEIYRQATAVGIGIVDAAEIDRINILQASLCAMELSVRNLSPQPDHLLIDGPFGIQTSLPQQAIKKGDSLSISIAAASIVAKVTRDRLMGRYDQEFPQFGFSSHKGYPTKAHKEAIRRFGCCPIHRRTFSGAREYAA